MDEQRQDSGTSEELLRRALLDAQSAAAIALQVGGLPVSETVTVIFHGSRDLGTIQTYVAPGGRAAGDAVAPSELLRVPCDLDLGEALDRDEARRLYALQAAALRDAITAADTVLAVWQEPLSDMAESVVEVERAMLAPMRLPAHRLIPTALRVRDRGLVVTAVCGARTLAEGKPPLGIVCAQPDLARVYPLPDDPERCLEDFFELAAEHARRLAEHLDHQDTSVQRFLELSGDDFHETA